MSHSLPPAGRMPFFALSSISLLCGLLAATAQAASQAPASAAAKGRITPLAVQVTDSRLPPSQSKALTTKLSGIIDQVLQTPPLRDPHGFSLTRSIKIDPPLAGYPWHPARAEVVMIAQEIDLSTQPKPDANGAYMGRLEGPTFRIGINNLAALYSNLSSDDQALSFLNAPQSLRMQQGYPVFRVGMRDVILITPVGKQPYLVVSKAEYLQFLIDEDAAQTAQFGQPTSPRAKAYQARLAAAKTSLTTDTGKDPACASARLSDLFGDCGAADAAPYVRLNTAYFDHNQPQGSVQMVTISTPAEGGHGHPRLEPKFRAAAAALDLDAIRARLN